jgi:DNA-directed RNA polymerase specialized sigma subunit
VLIKSDGEKEKKIIEELISEDEELRKQHELFEAEMKFKQQLIDARKAEALTQKDISRMTGLSQQAVSRMEKGASGTIETIIRYLNSMGYSLAIQKKV